MSEENDAGDNSDPKTQEDPLKNLKAEMDRKIGNFESKVDQMAQTNQQLLAQIQALATPPAKQADSDDFDDLFIDNPKEAARRIKEETAAEIRAEIEQHQKTQQKQTRVLTQLTQKFPELGDPASELTQKAVEIYNAMDADEQTDPRSYKLAVGDAALELGIQPLNKRKKKPQDDDDDSFSVASSGNPEAGKTRTKTLDPKTVEVARLMGLDIENEKVLDNLKKRAKRTKWSTYQ